MVSTMTEDTQDEDYAADEPTKESEQAGVGGECFSCGSTEELEKLGGVHLCPSCTPDTENDNLGVAEAEIDGVTVRFDQTVSGELPDDYRSQDRWMMRKKGEKYPYAPWRDGDRQEKRQWGDETNYRSYEKASMALDDPRFPGLTYLHGDGEPFSHIDLDDVRNDDGEVHPAAVEVLKAAGGSFIEVSTSEHGLHGIYRGTLPEGVKQAGWKLDDDPFVGEELPEVEIYDGARVLAVTEEKAHGAPVEANEWDEDGIRELIEEYDDSNLNGDEGRGELERFGGDDAEAGHEFDDYEPDAENRDESTSNIKDITAAIDRLDARRVADETIVNWWNDDASTSDGKRAFDPTWGADGNGTANIVDRNIWQDTGGRGGYGDPIHMAAIDLGIIRPSQSPTSIKGEDFWDCVERLRDLGFDIPEYESAGSDGGFEAVLPEAVRYLGDGELRRRAKKSGVEWPTADDLYEKLRGRAIDAMESGERLVINAPTGVGKTHLFSSTPWFHELAENDEKPVAIFHSTTDARDEAYQMSEDAGLDAKKLQGRRETCAMAQGKQDPHNPEGNPEIRMDGMPVSEWIDDLADKCGIPYSVLHKEIEEEHSGKLVCEEGDTQCRSKTIFDDVPRDEEGNPTHDIIHATKPFAHVPSMRMQTHMVFDEKPDYGLDLYQNDEQKAIFKRSVEAYLDWVGIPINSYHDLVAASKDGVAPGSQERLGGDGEWKAPLDDDDVTQKFVKYANDQPVLDAADWDMVVNYARGKDEDTSEYDASEILDLIEELTAYQTAKAISTTELITEALKQSPALTWFQSQGLVHANANAFARAIWEAEEQTSQRYSARVSHEPPRLDAHAHDTDAWNRETVSVVFDTNLEPMQGWSVPDTTLATSVIGLDAHAQAEDPLWQANLMPGIETEKLITGEKRARYRRYERGLHVVRVGEATHPVTGGKYIDGGQGRSFRAMVERLRQEYGDDFRSVISSKDAVEHLEQCLRDAGEEDPKTMYYGIEESNNDFAGEYAGYVAGAIEPGDGPILNTAAALGLDAEPEKSPCEKCGGEGCESCNYEGENRVHGREFVGKDADAAKRVLQGVREHHVHQSIGRFARDARDPDTQAVVYVHTDAVADHMYDAEVPGPVWTTTENQKDVLEALEAAGSSVTTQELADRAGCTREAARQVLNHDRVRDAVVKHPGQGKYGADLWEPTPELSTSGEVEIDGANVPDLQDARTDTHTWSLEIRSSVTYGGIPEGQSSTTEVVQFPLGFAADAAPPPE